jgi:hypothetical protein
LYRAEDGAHHIAQAIREKLGTSGMEKIVAFDQSRSLDDFLQLPEANSTRTPDGDGVVIFPGTSGKTLKEFNAKRGFMVRSEGEEDIRTLNDLPKCQVHFRPARA